MMTSSGDSGSAARLEAAQWMTLWAESLTAVLESMTGHRPTIEFRAKGSAEAAEELAWWGQSISIVEQPGFWIGAREDAWSQLGRLTLSALGVEEPGKEDIEGTCRDLMGQASAAFAGRLTQLWGTEATGGDPIRGSRPDSAGAALYAWTLEAGMMSMEGEIAWTEALLARWAELTPRPAEGSSDQGPAGENEPQEFGGHPVASIPKLNLRVKFTLGRTTLPLREVFKLGTGSVIDLALPANEPANMVVHGRVVARGQVVVINGNYGLKILPYQQ
jgi:flagellar motor switch protein FliN